MTGRSTNPYMTVHPGLSPAPYKTHLQTNIAVTVVSPRSHFSFTPFLASAAVGTLEFRCTTEPVRGIKHVNYAQGWANGIDFEKQQVEVEPSIPAIPDYAQELAGASKQIQGKDTAVKSDNYMVNYDKLVISVGCYSQDFGIPGVCQPQCRLASMQLTSRWRSTPISSRM